jgi:drug/metabolite transporter (DMT)-like permease
MQNRWLLILVGFNVLWGGTYSVFKDLRLPPGDIVTLRFGVAGALMLLGWPFMKGAAPRGRDLLKTLAMGVLVFVIGPRLQVVASQMGKAGDMSVLVGLEPLVTTVGAALLLHEHVPLRRWLGFALGLIGAVLLSNIWKTDFHLASLSANLLFIASFFCESAYSVIGKPLLERYGILKLITLALVGGMTVNLALNGGSALAAAQTLPLRGWLEIAYLGIVCTAIGYAVWFGAIRVVPVSAVAMTLFIQPFAGSLIAIAFLRESPHWGQLWGGLVIGAGLLLGLRQGREGKTSA